MNRHNCTIIIDTNQFCRDYMLSGMRWKQLIEYLGKTDASLQMPSVVWEEVKRNYTKHLSELFTSANSSIERLNHHTNFKAPHFKFWGECFEIVGRPEELPIADLVERYLSFVKATLQLKSKDFLLWDSGWFEDIFERAIHHVKPFGDESDKGFKDTLLWKTILSLGKRPGFKDGPIILISSNSKDFGDPSEKGRIHPTLAGEARDLGLDLHYFDNLDIFLEKWAADAIAMNVRKMKHTISEAMIKAALRKHVAPWLAKHEAVDPNIFLSGTTFKIESEAPRQFTVRISLSGYLTNTWTSYEYVDFNAEAIYKEEREEKKVSIEAFSILAKDKFRKPSWPELENY